MSYISRLDDILQLLNAKAIDPGAAVETVWGMQDARQDRRQAARQAAAEAQSGVLESLVSTAQSGAAAGQTMDQLKPLLDSIATQGGMPSMPYGRIPAIDPLFEGGYSTVDPGLDAEDEAVVMSNVQNVLAENPMAPEFEVRKRVHNQQAQVLGPLYERLAPSIDDVVSRVYGRST